MTNIHDGDNSLILASEECPVERFSELHRFSSSEERVIRKLIAHGPVLIRGGRGSGKSAIMIETHRRIRQYNSEQVFSVYVSLRYLPLLKSDGEQYQRHFCEWLSRAIIEQAEREHYESIFPVSYTIDQLQQALGDFASALGRRIVLLMDDAAHIGREKPLSDFFDIFRVLSTSLVSCKASIYPGVTKFGVRFDVFNDATIVDVIRDERSPDFTRFFVDVIGARYPFIRDMSFSQSLTLDAFANILGRAVVGNMRAFVFACRMFEENDSIGLPEVNQALLKLASDYYWPLIEEVAPKLGPYEALVSPSQTLAEAIFSYSGQKIATSIIVHKDFVSRFAKLFEILEYVGFFSRRDASKAMKSGGRGTAYAVNLCNLTEKIPNSRVTSDIISNWTSPTSEPAEIHVSSNVLSGLVMPSIADDHDLGILLKPIDILAKSKAYPYGLTAMRIANLKQAGIQSVNDIAEATDEELLRIESIGDGFLRRIRDTVNQAIWM
jgi:hypothetical protein